VFFPLPADIDHFCLGRYGGGENQEQKAAQTAAHGYSSARETRRARAKRETADAQRSIFTIDFRTAFSLRTSWTSRTGGIP